MVTVELSPLVFFFDDLSPHGPGVLGCESHDVPCSAYSLAAARACGAESSPLRALATYEAQGLPMPKLGFNEICVRTPFVSDVAQTGHTLGFIDEILVQVGETVAVDQTVAVIETDKAAIDIRSPVAGQISKLCVSPEDKVYELHPSQS